MTTYDFVMKQRSLMEQQQEKRANQKLDDVPANDHVPLTKRIKLRLNSIFKRNRVQIQPKSDPQALSIISGAEISWPLSLECKPITVIIKIQQ